MVYEVEICNIVIKAQNVYLSTICNLKVYGRFTDGKSFQYLNLPKGAYCVHIKLSSSAFLMSLNAVTYVKVCVISMGTICPYVILMYHILSINMVIMKNEYRLLYSP